MAQEAGYTTRGSTLIYHSSYNRSRTHFPGTMPKGLTADDPHSLQGEETATLFDHCDFYLFILPFSP